MAGELNNGNERKPGPQIARSGKETKRYGKRIILVFISGVGLLLFIITAQAQFQKNRASLEERGKHYRPPQQAGFAELAAGMRRDRRQVQAVTPPGKEKPPEKPERWPEKPAQRSVIKTAGRTGRPRYYSDRNDARAAGTLRALKLQALAAEPVAESFKPGQNQEINTRRSGAPPQNTAAGGVPSVTGSGAMMAAAARQDDPNGQLQKQGFLRENGGVLTPQGYSPGLPVPQQFPYELKAGTVIPGIMLTGINSGLPGNVAAQVSENVWDTATGKYVLIPKGTKVLGVYDSQITFGQGRVLLAWNRLVFPNGMTLSIAGSPGADQAGYSGLSGRINGHWGEMLKSALLASVFAAGAEITYGKDSRDGDSRDKSPRDAAAESAAGAIIGMGARLMDRAAGIQPEITVRPGKRMGIFVQQDIVFPFPYF